MTAGSKHIETKSTLQRPRIYAHNSIGLTQKSLTSAGSFALQPNLVIEVGELKLYA